MISIAIIFTFGWLNPSASMAVHAIVSPQKIVLHFIPNLPSHSPLQTEGALQKV